MLIEPEPKESSIDNLVVERDRVNLSVQFTGCIESFYFCDNELLSGGRLSIYQIQEGICKKNFSVRLDFAIAVYVGVFWTRGTEFCST